MKLLLVFPPLWETTQPFLSLPSLTAYLRENGHEVKQRDLNIEFHETVTSAAYLQKIMFARGINYIKNKISNKILSKLATARANLKNHNFYDPEQNFNNRQILKGAYQILSNLYRPTLISENSLKMKYQPDNSAHLRQAIQDGNENPFIAFYQEYFLEEVKESKPQLVGISITSESQLIPGFTLCRLLKRDYPDIPIVIGGFVISNLAASLREKNDFFQTLFDYLIEGEGERPLLQLVHALEKGDSLEQVNALSYCRDGKIHFNQPQAPVPVNNLPTPDFDGFFLKKYLLPEPVLPLFTSRTCYFKKCTFCDMFFDNPFQLRKTSKIVDDIKKLKQKYQVKNISFSDLTIAAGSCYKLAQELNHQQIEIRWFTTARFEKKYNETVCKEMFASGCRLLLFGLESASERILKIMEKGTEISSTKKILENTSKAGIWAHAFIIFGFPSETREEAQETIDFVFDNQERLDSVGFSLFSLKSNSPVGQNPSAFAIEKLDNMHTDLELKFTDYKIKQGMQTTEKQAVYLNFRQQLWEELQHPLWMTTSSYATLMLYIEHYGRQQFKEQIHLPRNFTFMKELVS